MDHVNADIDVAKGNMTTRSLISGPYVLAYDAKNRARQVQKNGVPTAAFGYDGDGKLVTATTSGTTTFHVGNYYEKTGSTVRKYYYHGGWRVAMRENGVLSWLLTDQLGSTSMVLSASGVLTGELRYKAWGETRYVTGTTPTDYRFTGQREESSIGLYFYNARWYDPALGRFAQADSIVPEPGNPQELNRYTYVHNNPLRYVDPLGMFTEEELLAWGISQEQINQWRKDLLWWAFIEAAQLGDKVTAINPFTSGNPRQVEGYFNLLPDYWKVPQRLILCDSTDLEGFRQKTRGRELSRLNGLGEWKPVTYPRQFLQAQQRTPGLYFDADAVDWSAVGLDAVGLATLGLSSLPRAAADVRGWAKGVNAATGAYQMYRHGTDMATGNGDLLAVSLDVMSVAPVPPLQTIGGVGSLLVDLSKGVKIR